MAKREIWFERWLWSYVPCHWKGWLVLASVVTCSLVTIGLLSIAVRWAGHPDWDTWIFIIVFVVTMGILEAVCSDHSRPRSR